MSLPSLDDADDLAGVVAGPADVAADPPARARPNKPAPEDPRPFVERYRGTQWDAAPLQVPPVARPRHGLTLNWPILIAGVLVVLTVAVGGAFVMIGQKKPTGLAAFRNTTPAPVSVWVVPAATATPAAVGTGSPATLDPSPSPPPWLADPAHPVALFIAQMSSDEISFHLSADFEVRAGTEYLSIAYELDAAGEDYAVVLEMTGESSDLTVRMVVKDGTFYAKVDDGSWLRGEGAPPPGNVFGEVTAESYDGIGYVGEEAAGGRRLHHLRLPVFSWPGPADRAIAIVRAPSVFTWDVWADNAGRPRLAEISFDVTMRIGSREVQATLVFDYRFTKFGRQITIQAPAP